MNDYATLTAWGQITRGGRGRARDDLIACKSVSSGKNYNFLNTHTYI